MNISSIKRILSSDHITAESINPTIGALKKEDLDKLAESEKEALKQILSNMLIMSQDPASGAHLDDFQKAKSLLSILDE